LELRFDIKRAFWLGEPIDLTLTEFRMVSQLAVKPGPNAVSNVREGKPA
jgi:hypothetical protein